MKKAITFGEILLRLSTKEYLKFSQANEFNVATSMVNFGMDTDLGRYWFSTYFK